MQIRKRIVGLCLILGMVIGAGEETRAQNGFTVQPEHRDDLIAAREYLQKLNDLDFFGQDHVLRNYVSQSAYNTVLDELTQLIDNGGFANYLYQNVDRAQSIYHLIQFGQALKDGKMVSETELHGALSNLISLQVWQISSAAGVSLGWFAPFLSGVLAVEFSFLDWFTGVIETKQEYDDYLGRYQAGDAFSLFAELNEDSGAYRGPYTLYTGWKPAYHLSKVHFQYRFYTGFFKKPIGAYFLINIPKEDLAQFDEGFSLITELLLVFQFHKRAPFNDEFVLFPIRDLNILSQHKLISKWVPDELIANLRDRTVDFYIFKKVSTLSGSSVGWYQIYYEPISLASSVEIPVTPDFEILGAVNNQLVISTLPYNLDVNVTQIGQGRSLEKVEVFVDGTPITVAPYSGTTWRATLNSVSDGAAITVRVTESYSDFFGNQQMVSREKTVTAVARFRQELYGGGVTPDPGSTDDPFLFYVSYLSQLGVPPDRVQLHLDGATPVDLQPEGSSWTTGVRFTGNVGSLSAGEHNYYFTATVGGTLLRWPATGTKQLFVSQSATGYDAAIGVGSHYSPTSVKAGTRLTLNVDVTNKGTKAYSDVPIRAQLIGPSGSVLQSTNGNSGPVQPGYVVSKTLYLDVPSNAANGIYTITVSLLPALDENQLNNSVSWQFSLGSSLSNEQYRVTQSGIYSPQDVLNLNGMNFTFWGGNSNEVYVKDPSGNLKTIVNEAVRVWSSYGSAIVNEGVFGSGAFLKGAVADLNGPVFSVNQITAYRGRTAYFEARSKSGQQFVSTSGNYAIYTIGTSSNYMENWIQGVELYDSRTRIRILLDIPADAPLGTKTFYLLTEYSGSGTEYITRLSMTVKDPPPEITSLSKNIFSADDELVINGTGFGTGGQVKFNDIAASKILAWANTRIRCIVPEGISSGSLFVVNSSGTSNPVAYQVISPTGRPDRIAPLPDLTLMAGSRYTVGTLEDYFRDPNGDALVFGANVIGNGLQVDPDSLTAGVLHLQTMPNVNDSVQVIITAQDPGGKSAADTFLVVVFDINDPPQISALPDTSFAEDDSLVLPRSFFSRFLSDPDDPVETLNIQLQNTDPLRLDVRDSLLVLRPPLDWAGEVQPLVVVSDGEASAHSSFRVRVFPVNDAPRTRFPDFSFPETDSLVIWLPNYLTDPDHPLDSLRWQIRCFSFFNPAVADTAILDSAYTGNVKVSWDSLGQFLHFVPKKPLPGSYGFRVFAEDPMGAASADTFHIIVENVNDPPLRIGHVADIRFPEDSGEQRYSVHLAQIFSDPDLGDSLRFFVAALDSGVSVQLVGDTLALRPDPDFFGQVHILLEARDSQNAAAYDTLLATVLPVNDPPVLSVPDTLSLVEDLTLSIYLDSLVNDVDDLHANLTWNVAFLGQVPDSLLRVILTTVGGKRAAVIKPAPNFVVDSLLLFFEVRDTSGAAAADTALFRVLPVNDAPVSQAPLPEIVLQEDDPGQWAPFRLRDIFTDPDPGDSLQFAAAVLDSGITVSMVKDSLWLQPGKDFFGRVGVQLQIQDRQKATVYDTLWVLVQPVNDVPVLSLPDSLVFLEDHVLKLSLNSVVTDVDDPIDSLKWNFIFLDSLAGANVYVLRIKRFGVRYIQITPKSNFNTAPVPLVFEVQDTSGATDRDTVSLEIISVNDPLRLWDLEFRMLEDDTLKLYVNHLLHSNYFIYDPDTPRDQMSLEIISIPPVFHLVDFRNAIYYFLPDPDWTGTDTLVVSVSDGEYSDTARIIVTIVPVNDPPVAVADTFFVVEDQPDTLYPLANDTDPENDTLSIRKAWSKMQGIVIVPPSGRQLVYTPPKNFYGTDTLYYEVSDGQLFRVGRILVHVQPVEDPPELVKPIPDLYLNEDFPDVQLPDLHTYFADPDGDSLIFQGGSVNGNVLILVEGSHATLLSTKNFFGTDSLYIWASDGHSDSVAVAVFSVHVKPVNDPPQIHLPTWIPVLEDSSLTLGLDSLATDVDNDASQLFWHATLRSAMRYVTWSDGGFPGLPADSNSVPVSYRSLKFTIDPQARKVTFEPFPDSTGAFQIEFYATDPGGLYDIDTVWVIVVNRNDAPRIPAPLTEISVPEDAGEVTLLAPVRSHFIDPDPGDSLTISCTWSDSTVRFILSGDSLKLELPADYFGDLEAVLQATDRAGAAVSDTFVVHVLPVNDPPKIVELPSLVWDEDDTLKMPIRTLWPLVEDPDNPDSTLTFRFTSGQNVRVWSKADTFYFSAPSNWFGKDTLFFAVGDGEVEISVRLAATVQPVNDAPVIRTLPQDVAFSGGSSWTLPLWDYVNDAETPDSLLQFRFETSTDSVLVEFAPDNGLLTLAPQSGYFGPAWLRIEVRDDSGAVAADTLRFTVTPISGVEKLQAGIPDRFILYQNFPNPFNPETTIRFGLPVPAHVRVEVFNLLGKQVATLLDRNLPAGYHQIKLDARRLGSGVYFYVIRAGSFRATKKMVIMR